jgi:ribose 5-phosphate isomerase B
MRVHLGCDHAGFELKESLRTRLADTGHEVIDHGAHEYDALDDYPPFCIAAAVAVVADREEGSESLGIVIGGSGNGEQIAANKVNGARCALVWNPTIARLAREHNDANLMGIGARQHTADEVWSMVEAFLATPFASGEDAVRHARRISLLADYETSR